MKEVIAGFVEKLDYQLKHSPDTLGVSHAKEAAKSLNQLIDESYRFSCNPHAEKEVRKFLKDWKDDYDAYYHEIKVIFGMFLAYKKMRDMFG